MTHRFCTKCGYMVDADQQFCPSCGARMTDMPIDTGERETLKKIFQETGERADLKKITACRVEEAEIAYDGAHMKAGGSVHLETGTNVFYIKGLPRKINTSSVRLYVAGCSGSRFEVPHMVNVKVPVENTERISALKREIELLDMQEELYKTNAVFTGRTNVTMEESLTYLEELPHRLQEIGNTRQRKKKELEKLTEAVEKENQFLMPVTAECGEEGDYVFELSYTTESVVWEPFYEIYAGDEGKVTFRLKGTVRQAMEEDWENCRLTLSAGSINQSGNLPELSPYILYGKAARLSSPRVFSSPMYASSARRAPSRLEEAATEELAQTAPVPYPPENEFVSAEIKEDMHVKYELPGTWHINHGGKGSVVGIHTFEADASYRYETVPKKDEAVYKMAEIKDINRLHLLHCRANVYQETVYIGSTEIDPNAGDDTFKLTLGRDDRVHVTRKETDVQHSTALFKNTQTQQYTYEITVENLTGDTVDIKVYDQYPVSLSTEITVERGDLTGAKTDEKTGCITWNLNLAPQEKKVLTFGYTVTWPKGNILR